MARWSGPPPGEEGAAPPDEEMAGGEAPAEAGPPAMIPIDVQSVPTTVVRGPDGAYYVGELTGAPFPIGGASVHRVVPGEASEIYATGFTNIIDIGFGPDETLYVAEIVHDGLMSVFAPGSEVPPIGAVLAVPPGGGLPVMVATGEQLMALGGLAAADDGSVYVTTNTLMPGAGALVKITP